MSQVKRKHQFQIRKGPPKRFIPEKTPQLYALDVHSICLPHRLKNKDNWASLNNQLKNHANTRNNYEDDFNQQILSSKAYKELYSKYLSMRQERQKQKNQLNAEIKEYQQLIEKKTVYKQKLCATRDGFYTQIESLRDQLTQQRDKNYNLRWEVYNQRGAHYANLYGYSFLEANQLTFQQILQMQEQIGSVNTGLTLQQINRLQNKSYHFNSEQENCERQICCICYDQIGNGELVTILKCRHTHHCDCLKDWLVKQRVCPICKMEVVVVQKDQKKQDEKEMKEEQEEKKEEEIQKDSENCPFQNQQILKSLQQNRDQQKKDDNQVIV